jgi:hypothetical protein
MVRRAEVILLAERQASPMLYYLFQFKHHARSTIARILPEPQAALLTGILLGVEIGIPRDLMDDFAATGTTHIIAISGFNGGGISMCCIRDQLDRLLLTGAMLQPLPRPDSHRLADDSFQDTPASGQPTRLGITPDLSLRWLPLLPTGYHLPTSTTTPSPSPTRALCACAQRTAFFLLSSSVYRRCGLMVARCPEGPIPLTVYS